MQQGEWKTAGIGKQFAACIHVYVTGLTDAETGKDAAITYTTEFFDPTEYTPTYVKTVTADGIEKYIIYKDTVTTENLNKIAYALGQPCRCRKTSIRYDGQGKYIGNVCDLL